MEIWLGLRKKAPTYFVIYPHMPQAWRNPDKKSNNCGTNFCL